MGERRSDWRSIVIGAVVFLVVSAVAVTVIALWPEEESVSPPGYTIVEEESYPGVVEWGTLSREVLETVSLEAVREYMPTAASLILLDPEGEHDGNYGILDTDGAELGIAVLDEQGKIASERIYNLGFEEAKSKAVGLIAEKGINPELLLLEEANIHHASEHVTEIQLMYRPHIGDVPVYNQDACSIWINPSDGSIMTFQLSGSFVLPDMEVTETVVTADEAVTMALGSYKKDIEAENALYDMESSAENIEFVMLNPVRLVYVQTEDSIEPFWEINVSQKYGAGGRAYKVNATTGEVMQPGIFL